MHIADSLAAAFAAIGFTARPIGDGMEYSGRVVGAAMGGAIVPDGARVMRFTIDATGRWLASVDGWGKPERECDLRGHGDDTGAALREVAGDAWPAIKRRLEAARAESVTQSDACRFAAGVRTGKAKRQAAEWAAQHGRNALALAAIIEGPLPECVDVDALAAALSAD